MPLNTIILIGFRIVSWLLGSVLRLCASHFSLYLVMWLDGSMPHAIINLIYRFRNGINCHRKFCHVTVVDLSIGRPSCRCLQLLGQSKYMLPNRKFGSFKYNNCAIIFPCNRLTYQLLPCHWQNLMYSEKIYTTVNIWQYDIHIESQTCCYQGTYLSSTNKTDRHDITEILLKVALTAITLTPRISLFWHNVHVYRYMFNNLILTTIKH